MVQIKNEYTEAQGCLLLQGMNVTQGKDFFMYCYFIECSRVHDGRLKQPDFTVSNFCTARPDKVFVLLVKRGWKQLWLFHSEYSKKIACKNCLWKHRAWTFLISPFFQRLNSLSHAAPGFKRQLSPATSKVKVAVGILTIQNASVGGNVISFQITAVLKCLKNTPEFWSDHSD